MKTIYVYEIGAVVKKANERIAVLKDGMVLLSEPLINVEAVALLEQAQVSSQAMVTLLESGIPVFFMKKSGRITGTVQPSIDKSIFLRLAQYDAWKNESLRCQLAKSFVLSKMHSQKIHIAKHRSRAYELCKDLSENLDTYVERVSTATDVYEIMGLEGASTNSYYDLLRACFVGMPFAKRSKHPPRDEVNSLLSLGYMLLLAKVQTALAVKGFDTGIGFLHSIQASRDSLGLDILEVYRPYIDNMVLTCVNRREIIQSDFQSTENGAIVLNKDGFRKFIKRFTEQQKLFDSIPKYVDWLHAIIMSGNEVVPWQPE